MPLTAAQIVSLACQDAKCPGFTTQAGQLLNATLQDLYQDYDLELCRKLFRFNFNSAAGQGSGPYFLPKDYLRTEVIDGKDNFFYIINGVPYPLIQITIAEYHWLVQTPGFQSYPYNYATDLSKAGQIIQPATVGSPFSSGFSSGFGPPAVTPPPFTIGGELFVWPPASGSYDAFLYYFSTMPDISAPEASDVIPWFPNTQILIRSLAGRLMGLTNDDRQTAYLGDDEERYPLGAGTLLKQYLRNVKDREGAVQTVGLDRRRWGRPFDRLKNTKTIGWMIAFALLLFAPEVKAQTGSAKTPTQLTSEINMNFADNTAGLITPALARQTFLDMSASFGNILVTNAWGAPQGVTGGLNTTGNIGIGPRFATAGVTPDAQLEVNMTNSATPTLPGPTGIHIVGQPVPGIATGRIVVDDYQQAAAFGGRRANGSPGSLAPLLNGDAIQAFNSWGWDGSTYALAGQQLLMSGGAWTTTSHPTTWQLLVTPVNSVTPAVRVQVFPSGGMSIGAGVDPGAGGLSLGNLTLGVPAGTTRLGFMCIAANGILYAQATAC